MMTNNDNEGQLPILDNNSTGFDNGESSSISSTVPLERLIDSEQWDDAFLRFQDYPDEAYRIVDPTSRLGWTFLHWLCAIPNTPYSLLELVASLNPAAIIMPDNRYRDTPLHSLCRNSVTSANKVHLLLQYCPKVPPTNASSRNDTNNETPASPEYCDILGRNLFGGTVLHSACNHNALIEILQALVEANPAIMSVRTLDGTHAITALWLSYIQTIPGTMTVAKLLKHGYYNDAIDTVFLKFWNKLEYLATEYYYYCTQSNHSNNESHPEQQQQQQTSSEDRKNYVLQGLIRCDVPINLFFLALKMNRNYAMAVDTNGNTPLHLLVENRPYRLKEKDAIMAIVEVAPETILHRNNDGDNPLSIAIQNKIPWENGVDIIVATRSMVINQKHTRTGLYPFQYAATQGGRVAIETTYQLLLMRPDLLLTAS